jgi:large subunit ribosomal protein L30
MTDSKKKIPNHIKLKIIQTGSSIGRNKKQLAILKGLGLGKMNRTVERAATPEILGMVKKINHLVKYENI